MQREARLERALAAAIAAHAAALGGLALGVRGARERAIVFPGVETAVELIEESTAKSESAPTPQPEPGVIAPAAAGRAVKRPTKMESVPVDPVGPATGEASASATDPVVAPSGGDAAWTFGAGPRPVGTGAPVAAESSHEAEEAPVAPGKGAMDSVRSALDAHDRRVGLSAGSALVDSAREAVFAGRTPPTSHGRIELRVNASGVVTSVRVLDASSPADAWSEIGDRLAGITRSRPLRVPAGANGLVVTLSIDSSLRKPSGHEAGSPSVSVMQMPTSGSAGHRTKVNLTPLGGSIDTDPTDLLLDATSKAARVVSVTIASENRL